MEATIKNTESTAAQRKYIQKLCDYDQNTKEAVVYSATNGRTESLRETSSREADSIIKHLDTNWAYFDKSKTQHRYIMSLCHQLNWQNGINPDLQRLDRWLKSDKSPVKKPLKAMNKAELSKIISALESILSKQS